MGKSIFELADKFGYDSPWEEDWSKKQKKHPSGIPTISFKKVVPNEIPINNELSLEFIVDGEYSEYGGEKFILRIININKEVTFSTSVWDKQDGVEKGWSIKTKVTSKKEGKFTFHFMVNSQLSNSFILNFIDKSMKICPIDPSIRSHFVIHCTAGDMSLEAIKKHTKYDTKTRSRSKAHIYVMKDGTTLQIWPFSEKNVWATKAESKNNLKGQMFHVELNYGSPDSPTQEQYDTLAALYIDASNLEKCWPIIVPHIEIDRGLADGHSDPVDFDYNHFYEILETKGVPIKTISKFDHKRYWGESNYKVPWGSDKNKWPPILTGNPHK